MDSYIIERNEEDSHDARSRSNSDLPNTTARLEELVIKSSANPSHEEEGTILDRPTTTTSFLTPDPLPSSTTLIASPAPQQLTPFPDFSQAELDANWLFAEPENTSATGPTPIVRLDPAHNTPSERSLGSQPSISRSNSFPANMSTIGIQNFDPRFDSGLQQSYTWPRFDLGDQSWPQSMSPPMTSGQLTPGYDPKMMYARSISSSPPRPNLTPEQRELKRQRDVARRDSKVQMRRNRSTSNPYSLSPQPSPEMLSRSLSEYSNGLTPSPLLSQQSSPNMSNISTPAYLSGYTPDPSVDLYGQAFTMAPDFTAMPSYSMPYPMDSSLSFIPRPHSHSAGSNQQPAMAHVQALYQGGPGPKMGLDADGVRVVHSRPKPQCWEHGCNGRQFSTFSNLLRHQREKSGAAAKSTCPNCGAEFTRTTARNGHMAHEKCKQRRSS